MPWGSPPVLTVPSWMADGEVDGIVERHRDWIASERAKQRPRLRLDPRHVSEAEALEDTLDVDVFSPPRADWIDGSDAYLR